MPDHTLLGADLLATPPLYAPFPATVGNYAAAIYAVLVIVTVMGGLLRKSNRWMVPAMVIGGAVTCTIEPLLDVATGALHPIVGQPSVFTFMGRGIPLWTVLSYAIYYGGFGSLNLTAYMNGITRRGVWIWFLAPLLGDVLLEQLQLSYDLYYYYGNQPLVLHKFPMYQPAGNSTGEMFGTTVLFFLRARLTTAPRWILAAIVVMPLCGVMGYMVTCWPSYYAVHSTLPNAVVQACGALTWVIAGLMVYTVSLLVAVDSRFRREGRLILD